MRICTFIYRGLTRKQMAYMLIQSSNWGELGRGTIHNAMGRFLGKSVGEWCRPPCRQWGGRTSLPLGLDRQWEGVFTTLERAAWQKLCFSLRDAANLWWLSKRGARGMDSWPISPLCRISFYYFQLSSLMGSQGSRKPIEALCTG